MLSLKPFIRIIALSMILTSLLIYLGVKYHWGNQFNISEEHSLELKIPIKVVTDNSDINVNKTKNPYAPEIINNNVESTLISSMNKEQIAEQCINLLSKDIKDNIALELATVYCVVSNYQETYQTENSQNSAELQRMKVVFSKECKDQFNQSNQYSLVEKQLLIGICISDKLNSQ